MGRLLELPTVQRYMCNGFNGTTKDTLIEIDKAIEGHESYIKGVEFRVEKGILSEDKGIDCIERTEGKINRLWELAFYLIPAHYYPSVGLLNP